MWLYHFLTKMVERGWTYNHQSDFNHWRTTTDKHKQTKSKAGEVQAIDRSLKHTKIKSRRKDRKWKVVPNARDPREKGRGVRSGTTARKRHHVRIGMLFQACRARVRLGQRNRRYELVRTTAKVVTIKESKTRNKPAMMKRLKTRCKQNIVNETNSFCLNSVKQK